jgi:two-component system, NtrC family, response regulator AlgB
MQKVLIVDDDKNILTTLKIYLEDAGLKPSLAGSGSEGLRLFRQIKPEIVFLDLKLPDVNGLKVLEEILATQIKAYVIIITAYATIDSAVQAIKLGAFDYLPKPFMPSQIDHILAKIGKISSLESEVESLRAQIRGLEQEGEFLTQNRQVRAVLKIARQVADSHATVLLSGESGTGKGILARLIHDWGPRKDGPFVRVDASVLQENLLESDLFGHVKGAFTDAVRDKIGKLETAAGGTIFLDEVADMSPAIQAKLLHFLQHREFSRLGSTETLRVDARVLAATNRSLEALVQEKMFRQDLYYRLNVVDIYLPPLRERPEDIPLLAQHYLTKFTQVNQKSVSHIDDRALRLMQAYPWPGNIRELINVIERGAILSSREILLPEDLPPYIQNYSPGKDSSQILCSLAEMEKTHITEVLRHTPSLEEAAKVLGIDPATLWRKRKKYHLE